MSRAEPVAQTLEMIELSQAKGSELRNDRAELSLSSSRLLAQALLELERLEPLCFKHLSKHDGSHIQNFRILG